MPPPWEALTWLGRVPDSAISAPVAFGDGRKAPLQFVLYDLLRHEQALALPPSGPARPEIARILDLAQSTYGDLVGLLIGRPDDILESARDGDWSLRDLLSHAMAVEVRYAAQIEWAAHRADTEPLGIPDELLPCDRLDPPEPEYAASRHSGIQEMLQLLGSARSANGQRLGALGDELLDRPSLWGKLQMSVRMRAHQVAVHLTEVVVQAEKMLGADTSSEARRILRRCCATRGSHELRSGARSRSDLDRRYLACAGH